MVAFPGACSAVRRGERVEGACGLLALPFPSASERLTPTAPPLLAITLPDWGVPPGSSIPIPWAIWRGQHGEVLDTDVPDDCTSGGGVTETESRTSAVTGEELCSRSDGGSSPRPFLEPGGAAVDPSTSPVDGAWLAGGDLLDVIRATGDRDGLIEEEVRRAQAKVTAGSSRKKPPKWLHYLERATEWVDVAPLPSPVAGARVPPWARDFLLAQVLRVPRAALLAGPGSMRLCRSPGLRSPIRFLGEPGGLKRKRGFGEADDGCPAVPTLLAPMEPEECDAHSPASDVGVARGALPFVMVETPSWFPAPGEDSFVSDYSSGEDEGGTYLCPAWAIKHRIPHLVHTSAYEGDDCTGAYWADGSSGDGVAMRIVRRPAGSAVDPVTDEDGDDSFPPTADYGDGRTGDPQGTDDVALVRTGSTRNWGALLSPLFPRIVGDGRARQHCGRNVRQGFRQENTRKTNIYSTAPVFIVFIN